MNPTQKSAPAADLLGKDVPLEPKALPVPTCPACRAEVPYFYAYIHRLQAPDGGTMLFQTWCCPHANCRAILLTLPIGIEGGKIAAPGKSGWPGLPS